MPTSVHIPKPLLEAVDRMPRVPWRDDVSECFGSVKAALEKRGERIEDVDAAIAAHALALGAGLVTADTSHMVRVAGVVVEDWSNPPRA